MIDIETEVFNTIATKLREEYPQIFITSEYVKAPSRFPCVSVLEIDNSVFERTQTSSENENHITAVYEVNVYSNKRQGKKAECKSIATAIDNIFLSMGFTRTMLQPIPNLNDATIYRLLGRYRAVVSKDKVIYRR